jgi:RNA polymerase sigma-70 factor (ECF subfamily)
VDDDFELLRAWQAGDREAGNRLVRRHFAAVFGFFRHKVGPAADDLAQRTFLACSEGLASYRGEASFRGYLFGIARKQLLRHFGEHARGEKVVDLAETTLEQLVSSPSAIAAAREETRLLAVAIRRIPLELQLTLELYYAHELPTPDVAAALELPEGTVRSRLARARTLLRAEIERCGAAAALTRSTLHDLERWLAVRE